MELHQKYKTVLGRYGLTSKLRQAHFFTQKEHENALGGKREGGYYKTVSLLRATFKSPFKGKSDEFVSQYLRNSKKCLNYVYANRMGNGNEASGDGYYFRGGGDFQTTGRSAYTLLEKETGIPFVSNPDLILEEANSLISALIYWQKNDLNKYADNDNLDAISDIINIGKKTIAYGDANGFDDRNIKLLKWKKKLEL